MQLAMDVFWDLGWTCERNKVGAKLTVRPRWAAWKVWAKLVGCREAEEVRG